MLALAILTVFILILLFIIVTEYRNEKKYQAKRRPPTEKKSVPQKNFRERDVAREPIRDVEITREFKQLPKANYPVFSHVRLIEMGLSDDEAKEFVGELIPQIEVEIPLIEAAIKSGNFHKVERLTHGIKGSATNIGTGGVSALLVDYNTYLKTGTDIDIIKAYFEHLIHYTAELKTQYS